MVDTITVRYKEADASWRRDKWLVVYPHGGANPYEKKKQAIFEAKRFARTHKPAELQIEKMNGETSKIHKYGFK